MRWIFVWIYCKCVSETRCFSQEWKWNQMLANIIGGQLCLNLLNIKNKKTTKKKQQIAMILCNSRNIDYILWETETQTQLPSRPVRSPRPSPQPPHSSTDGQTERRMEQKQKMSLAGFLSASLHGIAVLFKAALRFPLGRPLEEN